MPLKMKMKALILFLLVIQTSCTIIGDDLTEFFSQEKVYNRQDAIHQLKMGIYMNIQACPNNHYSGLYAIETHLPVSVRQSHYTRDSIDNCTLLLAALPCSIDTASNLLLFTNAYLSILRNCGLKEVSL